MTEKPPEDNILPLSNTSRRSVIKGVAGMAGVAAMGSSLTGAFAQVATGGLPQPADSGIDHIVVLMMENRSFDHMLGWVPGAAGKQAGRTFLDTNGVSHASFPLAPNYQNCQFADPNHSFGGGRTHFDNGAMDGFLKTAKVGDTFPIGYYVANDVPFFAGAARHWTICDNYFCSILGPTWPNRFYMHTGQTDRLTTGGPSAYTNSLLSTLPSIWDTAAAAGVSAGYYYGDSAFTALWGGKYAGISFPFDQFLVDASAGTLPSITYIDPKFSGEAAGLSNDDHPLADIRNGQVLMNTVYQALTASPQWGRTLFVINYDEAGGFADHVPPALAPVSDSERTIVGNTDGRLGFRVPCVLIGPRARRGAVAKTQFDAVSILNMINWRFGLPSLGVRGVSSGNIATALDFVSAPNLTLPPPVNLVDQVYGAACAVNTNTALNMDVINESFADHLAEVRQLQDLMHQHGFAV
ncbi:MAG TPA: alkaline phosphatase family protein [Aliidongia sp.]|uniref:alkaline phosphatase family protein n=1 Tax=Aliidongia sp. TaxID=1914230 RepID=UPI002DDDB462|nr:alkaline phosphatase family protein [Aliidongia sp.]HEV2677880.1 alkaline phosphatase family protein [Aliidongia sp.]